MAIILATTGHGQEQGRNRPLRAYLRTIGPMTQHQPDADPQNFRIDRDGRWYHDGAPIGRDAIVALFAKRGLKRDDQGRYWLQSPFEKYAVEVEDVPFVITDYAIDGDSLVFTTNLGERVAVSPERPLELRPYPAAEGKIPYIEVRGGLYARIGRAVYYDLLSNYGARLTVGGQTYRLAEEDPHGD